MRFFIGIAAVLMSLTMVTANAEPVAGLYQVREELVSQESEVRDAGLQQAFSTLVQRLTGQVNAAQSAQLAEYQADPQALISRYGYEDDALIVNFDPQSVQSALRAADLPIWGSNRPLVLAWWLLNDDVQGVQLLSDGQPAAEALYRAAQYYGVPARLPLGDLNEQLLVGSNVLNNAAQLQESTERYNADALVVVQQQQDGEMLHAQWQLRMGDEHQQGSVSAASQTALARQIFAQVNQHLAQRFAIKPGAGQSLTVQVAGVDLERFVLVERLLEPFSAQLHEVNHDYVQWHVRSSLEQLRAQLALAHLQEKSAPAEHVQVSQEVSGAPYRLDAPLQTEQTLYFGW